MDKNTTTGFILIAVVLIAFSYFNRPSAEEQRAAFVRDSIAQVENNKKIQETILEDKRKNEAMNAEIKKAEEFTDSLFQVTSKGAGQNIVLKNDKVELTLNSKGATVQKAVVKGFKDRNGNPDVTLFQGDEQMLNYTLSAKETNISTQDLLFEPSNVTDTTVTFTIASGEGKSITLDYLLGSDYMLHMQMRAEGMAGLFAPNTQTMDVNWTEECPQQEKGFMFENRYCTLTYKEKGGSTDYLNETSEKRDVQIAEAIEWVAFKDQFFSSIMIAKNDFQENSVMTSIPREKGSGYLKYFEAKMKTFFDPTGKTPSEFEFYYGPNDFRKLQAVETESTFGKDLQMKKLVYLGWPIVRWINRFFTIYVFDFLTGLGLNMGIVLILITLLLKAITYPLVKKSYMSSAKMRVLKPKLDEATKQYDKPEDQMQKQQAMMVEYAKYGVSPLSGCLPMLIQMPIWIAMFNFVLNAIQLRGEKFLWIDDLSTYDPIVEWQSNIWGIGDHLSLTCILFCVANILYSFMTMRQQRDQMVGQQAEQMKMMQWMMYLMPLMFFFMFNDYSSGLNFYYFISLFFSAAIMFVLRKTTNDAKLLAKLEAKYEQNKQNPQKKLGGLAGRLQAMQEEQQRLQKQREELANKRKNLGK
ncbi:MAG: membrane protein insertase YidC [Prevotella sp.]|nr:membrane protein insertase YidC [Prevotella sp.]